MNEPINHHYLPVFYLRQWCNADGKIVRYYRPHLDVVASPITPEQTAYEPHLYALDGLPSDQRQLIEKHYMAPVVDEPASRALQILIARNTPHPTIETRTDWTRFLMSLALRDPATVAKNTADARAGLIDKLNTNPEEYETARAADDPPTFVEWMQVNDPYRLDNIGKEMLPALIENEQIGTIIMQMRWFVFDLVSSGITLLTCDRPYIRTLGLKDERCIIVLPISPRLAFIATHSQGIAERLLKAGAKILAKDINARIVAQAVKHVYGVTTNHLRFVENRLAPVAHDTKRPV